MLGCRNDLADRTCRIRHAGKIVGQGGLLEQKHTDLHGHLLGIPPSIGTALEPKAPL